MEVEIVSFVSTRASALSYAPDMRTANVLASLLFVVPMGSGCESAEPMENVPGEFGDPCVDGTADDTPDGCLSGLACWKGYCEETCVEDSDCRPVEDWTHSCVVGFCQIECDENMECPSTLGVPLSCGVIGSSYWCEAAEGP